MAEKTGKELEVTQPGQYALVIGDALEQAELIREALAPGEKLEMSDLPKVKVPAAGGLNWEDEDGNATKTLEGVIVVRQPVRAYWKESFAETGGGTPPDCSSTDLVTGVGDNGTESGDYSYDEAGNGRFIGRHDCATCPMAQFGSAKDDKGNPTAGQACRQITRLFMLQEGQLLPTLVNLAPTSFKAAKKYALRQPLYSVVTAISLVNDNSKTGVKYSKAEFTAVRTLEPEERAMAEQYRRAILPFVSNVPIVVDASFADDDDAEY